MNKIAVLLTCFNRKEFTLESLKHLYIAKKQTYKVFEMDVFLTDDGSNDGTSAAVALKYPNVHILRGDGNLYWAGGMRHSWNYAINQRFDGFLLLNDDTFIYSNLFDEIMGCNEFILNKYKESGIYIGATQDKIGRNTTYGARVITNKFLGYSRLIDPNGEFQTCDLGNANIMFVSNGVYKKLGVLFSGYVHGAADYDYTLSAKSKNIPVVLLPSYMGTCSVNTVNKAEIFRNLNFTDRFKYLTSPVGYGFLDYLLLQKRHFKKRYPFVVCKTFLKMLFSKEF